MNCIKKDLMEILACPVCKSELTLEVVKEKGDEVIKGIISCIKCKIEYPIENGIPNMLPPDMRQ